MGIVDIDTKGIGGMFTSIREAFTGTKITDPMEMAKVELQLSKLESLALSGQLEINKVEAAHKSLFVAGWRPFIGWVCGIALAYVYIGQPMIEWLVGIFNVTQMVTHTIILDDGTSTVEIVEELIKTPTIDTDHLYQLVGGMLGMATLRTYEKKYNVQREK